MKKLGLFAAAILSLGLLGTPARADIVFDVTLTPTSGSFAGTGTLWILGNIDPWYQTIGTHSSSPLGDSVKEFTLIIDGHEFDLTNSFTNITFQGGAL